MKFSSLKSLTVVGLMVLATGGAVIWKAQMSDQPPSFASGNGRLEATEVDIATKGQGRVESVLANEGDMVQPGQIVATMDSAVLRAQLREAQAEWRRTQEERNVALAQITQRENEHDLAEKVLKRSQQLAGQGVIDPNQLDRDQAAERTAKAVLAAAKAQLTSAEAAIESNAAKIERIKADIDDTVLRSPRAGRVQYRLAEPGEVLSSGGRVLTLIDISDVYLTFFLPTAEAGRLALGGDARIVLDVLPNRPIPAKISFVSPTAQFTPKEVETMSEREKLMFRVKAKIDPVLLLQHAEKVKTGLPGVAHVRLDPTVPWPAKLESDLTIAPAGQLK